MKSIVQVVGQPGSGKTTLIANLVRYFTENGLSVGTLKHSSHCHELDKPGKDSYVHRNAGANPAGMATSKMAALYFPVSDLTRPDDLIEKYYTHVDIVLIEGWISGPYPKIEIWRKVVGKPPLFMNLSTVKALVCDSLPDKVLGQPVDLLSLSEIERIANYIRSMD